MKKVNKVLFYGIIGMFTVVFLLPQNTFAAAGDLTVKVSSELGYPISGVTVSLHCTSGVYTDLTGTTNAAGVLVTAAADLPAGSNCGDNDGISLRASLPGYLTTTLASTSSGYVYQSAADHTVYMGTTTATTSIGAMLYMVKVTAMTDELGTSIIASATTTDRLFAGQTNLTLSSSTFSVSRGAWYLQASSTGSGGLLQATTSGYINTLTSANIVTATSTQKTVAFDGGASVTDYNSATGMKFGLKVVVTDELGAAVTPTTATFGGFATTSSSANTLYWATTTANNKELDLRASGYLFATTTNAGFTNISVASTSQMAITLAATSTCANALVATSSPVQSCKGLQTMLKVTSMLNELGTDVMPTSGSPFSVGSGLTLVAQSYSGGAWYIAASSTGAGGTLTAAPSGYVSEGVGSVTTSTTTQKTVDYDAGTDSDFDGTAFPYALKVTVQKSSDSSALTGATVTAGSSYSISCSEDGTSGIYYCVIPITDNGATARAVKSSYLTNTNGYSTRLLNSSSQNAVTITLTASVSSTQSSTLGSSNGGGGGGYVPIVLTISPIQVPNCPNGLICTPIPGYVPPSVNCPVGLVCTPNFSSFVPASSQSISGSSFIRRLTNGISGDDVRTMQRVLNSDPDTRVANTGVGSQGSETNYFGGLTLKAVQKFQVKYGIAGPDDESYGQVGPKTRAKLSELAR